MDYSVSSSFNEKENCWNVNVTGEIDIFNSNNFKEKLIELTKQKEADIYINCADLSYIDSTALGVLVSCLKIVNGYGGEVHLQKLRHTIVKLFRITNLDKAFVIEGDIND